MAVCRCRSISVEFLRQLLGYAPAPVLSEPQTTPARVVALTVAIGVKSVMDDSRAQSSIPPVLRTRGLSKLWDFEFFFLLTQTRAVPTVATARVGSVISIVKFGF